MWTEHGIHPRKERQVSHLHHSSADKPEHGPAHKSPSPLRFFGLIAVSAAALLPLPAVSFLKRKLQKPAALQHFLQCAETYKYYLAVRRHLRKSGAVLYFAEAPEWGQSCAGFLQSNRQYWTEK